jgi:hypothetical protein
MKSFSFDGEYAYTGDKISLPAALILDGGIEVAFEAVLDTGAEVTLLNRLLARHLPIRIEDGEPITLGVVSGDVSTAYMHDVRLRILGEIRSLRVGFVPDWNTKNFLGMRGFFDQTIIAFDHANHRIYY